MPFLNAAAQRSPSSSPPTPSSGSRERKTSVQEIATSPQPTAKRRHSSFEMESPSGHVTYCSSPPDMEGPISFVAPELAEETLMDVRVLNFWLITSAGFSTKIFYACCISNGHKFCTKPWITHWIIEKQSIGHCLMLQLHLSDQQFYCILRCYLY